MLNGHLLNIDFAALRTLSEVKARGSFTGAAEALNLNQSTISYTMERLRRAFNDPLFVRQGGSIVAIAHDLGIPARFIGTGEGMEDFEAFEAGKFVESIL